MGASAPGRQQVLHLLDAVDAPRPLLEVADHLLLADLAAQVDLAVLGVDVDLALRDLLVPEELALDHVRERDVVGLRPALPRRAPAVT